MSDVTLIGIDLGKHNFHLHGQDRAGRMGAYDVDTATLQRCGLCAGQQIGENRLGHSRQRGTL